MLTDEIEALQRETQELVEIGLDQATRNAVTALITRAHEIDDAREAQVASDLPRPRQSRQTTTQWVLEALAPGITQPNFSLPADMNPDYAATVNREAAWFLSILFDARAILIAKRLTSTEIEFTGPIRSMRIAGGKLIELTGATPSARFEAASSTLIDHKLGNLIASHSRTRLTTIINRLSRAVSAVERVSGDEDLALSARISSGLHFPTLNRPWCGFIANTRTR